MLNKPLITKKYSTKLFELSLACYCIYGNSLLGPEIAQTSYHSYPKLFIMHRGIEYACKALLSRELETMGMSTKELQKQLKNMRHSVITKTLKKYPVELKSLVKDLQKISTYSKYIEPMYPEHIDKIKGLTFDMYVLYKLLQVVYKKLDLPYYRIPSLEELDSSGAMKKMNQLSKNA